MSLRYNFCSFLQLLLFLKKLFLVLIVSSMRYPLIPKHLFNEKKNRLKKIFAAPVG